MIITVGQIGCAYDPKVAAVTKNFEQVDQLDEPDMSYEFNTFLVIRHLPSDRILYGQSSGCSCPTPFEEYSIEVDGDQLISHDMNEVARSNFADFERDVNAFCSEEYSGKVAVEEKRDLIQKVRELLTLKQKRAA